MSFLASTANIQAKNVLQGHRGNVTSLAFSASLAWLLSASTDGTIRIWNLEDLSCQRELQNRSGINRAVLHPNQVEVLTADEGGWVKVWDLNRSESTVEMVRRDGTIEISYSFSSDSRRFKSSCEFGVFRGRKYSGSRDRKWQCLLVVRSQSGKRVNWFPSLWSTKTSPRNLHDARLLLAKYAILVYLWC